LHKGVLYKFEPSPDLSTTVFCAVMRLCRQDDRSTCRGNRSRPDSILPFTHDPLTEGKCTQSASRRSHTPADCSRASDTKSKKQYQTTWRRKPALNWTIVSDRQPECILRCVSAIQARLQTAAAKAISLLTMRGGSDRSGSAFGTVWIC